MLGVNYAQASECIDDDCELSPIIVEEEITEQENEPVDILEPQNFSDTIWSVQTVAQDNYENDCEYDYDCPFETAEECEIWYKKPIYKESVAPREPRINTFKLDEIIYALNTSAPVYANNEVFAPLVERYNMLIQASKACCTEGIIYKMHNKDASDKQIYTFLKDDANHYAVGTRCLVMNNDDIAKSYSNGVSGEMVKEVRNSCLCKNRKWFDSLLNPFVNLYQSVPSFQSSAFEYSFSDGLRRDITVSINTDVQNALNMLTECPD